MIRRIGAVVVIAVFVMSGCSTGSDVDQAAAEVKARELLDSLAGTGVAPRLTTDVAVSLYGPDAAGTCDVFEGGLNSNEYLLLVGNPSGRRSKLITTQAVDLVRHVVETYCPDELGAFERVVADLNPVESNQ